MKGSNILTSKKFHLFTTLPHTEFSLVIALVGWSWDDFTHLVISVCVLVLSVHCTHYAAQDFRNDALNPKFLSSLRPQWQTTGGLRSLGLRQEQSVGVKEGGKQCMAMIWVFAFQKRHLLSDLTLTIFLRSGKRNEIRVVLDWVNTRMNKSTLFEFTAQMLFALVVPHWFC